ncbi:MAG: virulence factor Mce family protein, partial [Actinomadura rubrobrunea]|nr:virulence factor Mce family protein [Actinomadura rubrobrunea]
NQTSLLGEKFVALSNPASEPPRGELGSGDVIPLSRTRQGTEVETVLSAMSMLLNNGGLEQISTITHELNAAMSGREPQIRSVLNQVNTFVGTLDRNRAAITRALDSIDRLTAKLSAERRTITETADRTGPAIEILRRNRADLTKMLVSLDKLSRTTTDVVNKSHADLVANLRDLDTILRNLNEAGENLPKSLESLLTFPFPPTFGNVIRGDYGNVRLTVDLDLENLARNLFGGTELESLVGSGRRMRDMLTVPNVTLPQTPLGVLPQTPGGGLPGLAPQGGQNGQNGGGQSRPGAMAPHRDLETLMTGGLS